MNHYVTTVVPAARSNARKEAAAPDKAAAVCNNGGKQACAQEKVEVAGRGGGGWHYQENNIVSRGAQIRQPRGEASKRLLVASPRTSTRVFKGVAAAGFRGRTRGKGAKEGSGAWSRGWLALFSREENPKTRVEKSFWVVPVAKQRYFVCFNT